MNAACDQRDLPNAGMSLIGKRRLTLATAQSLITSDIRANGAEIRRLMRLARAKGADIIHYPESAMSGCAKAQIKSWSEVDWHALQAELEETAALAATLGLWVVLGSAHPLASHGHVSCPSTPRAIARG